MKNEDKILELLAEYLKKTDAQQEETNKKLNTVIGLVGNIADDVKIISSKLNALETYVAKILDKAVERLESELKKTQNQLANNQQELSQLKHQNLMLEERLKVLEKKVG